MLLGNQALLLVVGLLTPAAGFLISLVWGGLALCTSLMAQYLFMNNNAKCPGWPDAGET